MKSLSIQKILFPIDFSEASTNALHTAILIARKHEAHVKLLFVHYNCEEHYPQINLHSTKDIIRALATLSKLLQNDELVSSSFSYMIGNICDCIIEVSNTEKADLIIMAKNSNRKRKNFAGTNADAVARKSTCPVLLIPAGKTWNSFTHILFPVRPMLSMIEKFVKIKEMAKKNNAWLHILNVRNPSCIDELHIISRLVQLLKIKTEKENIQKSISYYFRDEKFVEKILSVAHDRKNEIDLLVITSEDSNAQNTSFILSYAQKIIHNANVPVLIIKPETVEYSKEVVLTELEKQLNYN